MAKNQNSGTNVLGRRKRRGPATTLVAAAISAGVVTSGMGISLAAFPVSAAPTPPLTGDFGALDTDQLWAHIAAEPGTRARAVIGLTAPDRASGYARGEVLLDATEWEQATADIEALDGVSVVHANAERPVLTVTIDDRDTLAEIRKLDVVEFVEPGLVPAEVLSSGCSENELNTDADGGEFFDFTQMAIDDTSGDRIPVNFTPSNIREAWTRSAGAGVTVGVIDTGVFQEQTQLSDPTQFASGMSGGRTVRHFDVSGPWLGWDTCNHGTRSAGTITAPRNRTGTVGVAWQANLVSVKIGNDVLIDAVESDAVARGIKVAADNGARVISMAIGTGSWEYDNIRQEIENQHYNRDVLFVAAAGNTWCHEGVVFPAKMPQVVAVTATDANGYHDPIGCTGEEVDIAASITLAAAPGRNPHDIIKFGGTSAATAIVAGTAALIWAEHPEWTRDQVRERLLASGQGSRSWGTGTGTVDAYKSVGGFQSLNVGGLRTAEPGTPVILTARPVGDGPFTYRWSNGATTPSVTVTTGANGTSQTLSVEVTDTQEQKRLTSSATVRSEATQPSPEPPTSPPTRPCRPGKPGCDL